jgi:hypothetical protein
MMFGPTGHLLSGLAENSKSVSPRLKMANKSRMAKAAHAFGDCP